MLMTKYMHVMQTNQTLKKQIQKYLGGRGSWIRLWSERVISELSNYWCIQIQTVQYSNHTTPFPIYFWLFWFHGFIQCYFISQIIIQSAFYLLSFLFSDRKILIYNWRTITETDLNKHTVKSSPVW